MLVRGDAKNSDLICALQAAAVRRPSHYSHVILAAMGGVFIHANERGVQILSARELFTSSHWRNDHKVIRYRPLQDRIVANPEYTAAVTFASIFYLNQRYNYLWFAKGGRLWRSVPIVDRTSFCSELIAKVFEDLDLQPMGRRPARVYPVHFEIAAETSDWIDVTDVYATWDWDGSQIRPLLRTHSDSYGEQLRNQLDLSTEQFDALIEQIADPDDYEKLAAHFRTMWHEMQRLQANTISTIESMNGFAFLLEAEGHGELAAKFRVTTSSWDTLAVPAFWDARRPREPRPLRFADGPMWLRRLELRLRWAWALARDRHGSGAHDTKRVGNGSGAGQSHDN